MQYKAAADIITKSTQIEENCYDVFMENSRKTKFCNIPKHTLIVLPSNGLGMNAEVILNVLTEFNGKTTHAGWYCDTLVKRTTEMFHAETKPKLGQVMGWSTKDDELFLANGCYEDKCFDTRKGN